MERDIGRCQDRTDRCSLCDRLVLGLAGHDWCVLPWMLDATVTVADVRPGSCHVRCLQEGGMARSWADAVQEYHCARWPRWRSGVAAGIRWRLHHSPPARRFHLWRTDGRLFSFPAALAGPTPEGVAGPELTVELAEAGSAQAAVLLAAMGTDQNDVEVSLTRVVAALGLADRYPLRSGGVTRRLRNAGTARRCEPIDVLVARHPLHLDRAVLRAATDLRRQPM
jgi:hypothetical protein